MNKKITLIEWAKSKYSVPPVERTLWKWARNGNLYPPPEKHGRQYFIEPDAIYIKPNDVRLGEKIKKTASPIPAQNEFLRKVIRDTEAKVRR